ncbi:hypothetical protein [Methylobacterium nodulans]|uniref:Uncharacterized protein n=1 Tax=Methylobacterium nodulans (strain LMG 21967 / CNCM I-2342 / ORS 2060) TaxID=460265 RepID=B8ITM8_METNO|nr:hypothetical protein [Methylobacterium nodulans]ACL58944.1 hypothetical protein Mnod_4065 [Methylobacterium nodulans ORS 2060]
MTKSENRGPQIPKPTPVTNWPPEVQRALFELVAFAVNQGSQSLMFSLRDLTAEGRPLGNFEITITRAD